MEKPKIIVLGGCGFVGRNFVSFILNENLASAIRVVDKVPPQMAWLNERHQTSFNNTIVEFCSANLINAESCKNAFQTSDGTWDLVINCAGETKLGQTDPVYKEGILHLSTNCAKEAVKCNARHYVELSSGNMYSPEKTPHKEDGPTEPWTFVAKWKREVENELKEVPNLRYTILRLPVVYGTADRINLMPRIVAAATYKILKETMKLLWTKELKINTVHVEDVCRAIWFVCNRENTIGKTYNVVDDADSTQSSISNILADLFNISVDYYGNIISSVIDLEGATETANDKHLTPWAAACRSDDIQNTPLSPHTDQTLLDNKNLWLDGTALKELGFKLNVPEPTYDKFKEIIDDYVKMKLFPISLSP